MITNKLKNRIKFCPAKEKKIVETKSVSVSRREPNHIDASDILSDAFQADFFEFEKELSEIKASNKIPESIDRDKN
jgi:hypothetical protein